MRNDDIDPTDKNAVEDKLKQYETLAAEANYIREKDKIIIKSLFQNFYNKEINVGIGFQRAYGAILSGDYFDLIKLPDNGYLFIFADISGHGLPAYTTLIRLRSAITISINEIRREFQRVDADSLVKKICINFTNIMDEANSFDFACVNFTFIYNRDNRFLLKFYNRGMLFPIVIRKNENKLINIYDLNEEGNDWNPKKGYLLGSDVRKLEGESYLYSPCSEFMIHEGDSILFYSDGITEAHNHFDRREFGQERMIHVLKDNFNLAPQVIIHELFNSVYNYIGFPEEQRDDMTAVLIDFPVLPPQKKEVKGIKGKRRRDDELGI